MCPLVQGGKIGKKGVGQTLIGLASLDFLRGFLQNAPM